MRPVNLRGSTMTIKDSGSNSVEIKIGEGNLTFSEKRNYDYLRDRGVLDRVREGDQEPMDLAFDFVWEYLLGSVTVEEALRRTGNAADWATTGAQCDPYAVDVTLSIASEYSGCSESDLYTFSEFRFETLDHDLRAGTVSCSGRCNALAPA